MIRTISCRKLMLKYFHQATLTEANFEELVHQLEMHCPSVVPFIKWIKDKYNILSHCPSSIKTLVQAVCASSPVCGFIRPSDSVQTLLQELMNGINLSSCPEKMKTLQEVCPILFNVLANLHVSLCDTYRMASNAGGLIAESLCPISSCRKYTIAQCRRYKSHR